MDANELGRKAAELLDTTLVKTTRHALSAKHGVTTFLSAFKAELATRKLARQVPPVPEVKWHDVPVVKAETVGDVFRQHVAKPGSHICGNEHCADECFDEVPGRIQFAPRLGETVWGR